MIEGDQPHVPAGGGERPSEGPPRRPAGTNLAAVAGAIVLIVLVGLALYHRHRAAPAQDGEAATGEPTPPQGTPITAVLPYRLSPEATIIAERYRCVCGCVDLLNVCTCGKTPGSHDMRKHLQGLVDQKKSVQEIDAGMIAKYGPGVLLTNPVPSPSIVPAAGPAAGTRAGSPSSPPKAGATPRRATRPKPRTGP